MKFYQTWEGCLVPREGARTWFPCEVPGNIQYDYAKANGFADTLMYGTTAKRFLDLEDNYWEYRTHLQFEKENGEKLFFVAEGIDYSFDVLLNGEVLYSHEGMFTKTEYDITDRAQNGAELVVRIHPHPKLEGTFATPREYAAQSCKPPATYEWDWNPRLIISGIWKPCYLETRKAHYIEGCEPFYTLDAAQKTADVRFETVCAGKVIYTVTDREGTVVYRGEKPSFRLENVRLWWCNGQGEAYLYNWTAESDDHSVSGKIGFRTVRLVKNEGTLGEPDGFPKSRYSAPITVELNGRRIFAKGSNWVNPELFFGRITRERYAELVIAAKEANMNILRLWGGSGLKKREFYELCDENGIMLFQEFMLACNNYRGTPAYLAVLEQEATAVIRDLRRHPSIILWCGGNELFNGWSGMDDQSHALRLLDKLCYELDFERPFLKTSPLTGMKHGCYLFDDGRETVFPMFQNAHGTAYTEFGVPSLAPVSELEKIIPADELFPIEKTESWIYHHAFGAWGEERWACLDVLEKYFGKPSSLADVVAESQWLQCEGYKAIFEEARRQWPYCSMAINWCYDEPWITAANNALFTYPCIPKPAYYAVADSLRNTVASAKIEKFDWHGGETFRAELWLLNDAPETVSDTIRAELTVGGTTYALGTWETGDVNPNTNRRGITVSAELPMTEAAEMRLTLTAGEGRTNTYRLLYRAK